MAARGIRETPSDRSTGKCRWCNPLPFFFRGFQFRTARRTGKKNKILFKKKKKISVYFYFFFLLSRWRGIRPNYSTFFKKQKSLFFFVFFLQSVSQSQLTWFTIKRIIILLRFILMSKCQRDREIRHTTSHTHTQKLREQIERRRDVKDKRQKSDKKRPISAGKMP